MCLVLNGWVPAGAEEVYNWRNAFGEVWTSTSGQCWRSSAWTPETAVPLCDGALLPKVAIIAPVAPVKPEDESPKVEMPAVTVSAPVVAAIEPAVVPAVVPLVAKVTPSKINFNAVYLFDFDKAVITPEAQIQLNEMVLKAKNMNLEVIVAVGHTDATGSENYNQQLSLKRAAAVKSYLESKGFDKKRIFIEGRGENQPVVDNRTKQNRAKNRRVVLELTGSSHK